MKINMLKNTQIAPNTEIYIDFTIMVAFKYLFPSMKEEEHYQEVNSMSYGLLHLSYAYHGIICLWIFLLYVLLDHIAQNYDHSKKPVKVI
jgi:hypothetical protein